jgi:hypothetical protein
MELGVNIRNIVVIFTLFCFQVSFAAEKINWTADSLSQKVESIALETYTRIHNAKLWTFPEKGEVAVSTKSDAWDVVPRGIRCHGKIVPEFAIVKKPSFPLSQALKSLEESSTKCECMIAANFVSLKCLEALLGPEALNKLCDQWESKYQMPFYISLVTYSPLSYIFFDLTPTSILDWRGRGAFTHVANDPAYLKHLANSATDLDAGENIVQVALNVSGDPIYMGFDREIFSKPLSLESIIDSLHKRFDEVASKKQVKLPWDREKTLAANRREFIRIRTYSAHLVNEYLANLDLTEAEGRNMDVIRMYPAPMIVPDDEFDQFLYMQAFLKKLST